MENVTDIIAGSRWSRWRILMWGTAAFLLLLPAIAMRFTSEVDWDETDFIVMGVMLALACGTCELAARSSSNGAHRLGALVAVGTGFLTVWVNLAVGMIGSEDNPYNLWFGGVLAIAIAGSIVAGSRSASMIWAMIATAAAQAVAGAAGMPTDMRGAIFSMAFSLFWLLSATMFWLAARQQAEAVR